MAQHAAHVGVELAQLGLAAVGDQLADPLERDLLLDLAFVDEADRLPVGGRPTAPALACDATSSPTRSRSAVANDDSSSSRLSRMWICANASWPRSRYVAADFISDQQVVGDLDDRGVGGRADAVLRGRECGVGRKGRSGSWRQQSKTGGRARGRGRSVAKYRREPQALRPQRSGRMSRRRGASRRPIAGRDGSAASRRRRRRDAQARPAAAAIPSTKRGQSGAGRSWPMPSMSRSAPPGSSPSGRARRRPAPAGRPRRG